ncbi:hypothetical protein PsorP6_019416 [Peronosclerospora sorghi]|nr:hypothetical protein PsorP6_019416 [Peronosclerospora sorghi]
MDHLQSSEYGVLHVGDKFLSLKNGELSPGKMRADNLNDDPFLIIRMSYRGAQSESTCIVLQNGLHADLKISGWVMPLTLFQVFCEIMDVFSVLWVADTETTDTGVLDAVLGSYVKDIDPDALQISVWIGKIEVEDVEFQRDAFPLPNQMRLVKGTLRLLRIDLPSTKMSMNPFELISRT